MASNATAGGGQPDTALELAATGNVIGLPVHGRDGDKLGTISDLVLDKRTGHTAYVVLTSGGFLGLGQSYHPIPWSIFAFDPQSGGYIVAADKRLLDGAPSYRPDTAPVFDDAYGRRVTDYYRSPGSPSEG